MNKYGVIVIVEDDPDDRTIFSALFKELNYPNKIFFFNDGR